MKRAGISVTKEDVSQVLATEVGCRSEDILEFFSRTPCSLPTVKLAELKSLARYLRDRGYNISIAMNKGAMEAELLKIISSLPSVTSSSTTNTAAPPVVVPTPAVPAMQHTALPKATAAIIAKPQQSNLSSSIIPQQLSSMQAVMHANQALMTNVAKPSIVNNTLIPRASVYPPNIEARLRDLPTKKRRIFDECMQIKGMTATEVLDALRFINTADCNADAVIDKVVMKRSTTCDPRDDANIAALERSLYDRAVMESEKERDNIQQKKRQKISDLKNDIQSEILSYEEFKPSLLLYGLSSSNPNTSSSSSSSARAIVSTASAQTTKNGIDKRKLQRGSTLVRALVLLYDYVAVDSRSLELCELISAPIGGLRVSLVEVLLLERDALKYYKDTSYAYLWSIMHILDVECDNSLGASFIEELYRIQSSKALTSAQWRNIFAAFNAHHDRIRDVLIQCKETFQKGMVKIPRDGAMIPELFRLKSLLPYIKELSSDVEKDGIALTDDLDNLGLLSDRESIPSDDDFDDDGDY